MATLKDTDAQVHISSYISGSSTMSLIFLEWLEIMELEADVPITEIELLYDIVIVQLNASKKEVRRINHLEPLIALIMALNKENISPGSPSINKGKNKQDIS
ncbi:33968_t:CDS:2, partial [Gigaspora margarita]